MKNFSELTEKERYALGQAMGDKLLGTTSYPGAEMEAFLEARGIYDDNDPEMDADFCNGLDDTAMCCDSCNWYTEPHDLNEWNNCGDCAESEEGEEE